MYGNFWGHRGMFGTGGFSRFNYINSPLGFWLMIGLVLIVITLVVFFAVHLFRRSHGSSGSEDAMLLLKKRYARGEISREEYESIKKNLT